MQVLSELDTKTLLPVLCCARRVTALAPQVIEWARLARNILVRLDWCAVCGARTSDDAGTMPDRIALSDLAEDGRVDSRY